MELTRKQTISELENEFAKKVQLMIYLNLNFLLYCFYPNRKIKKSFS